MKMNSCLLYTSDAADERSSVDLGGRRIIKKKTTAKSWCGRNLIQKEVVADSYHNEYINYQTHVVDN